MSDITISWRFAAGRPKDTTYYCNGANVGRNESGFERMVAQLRASKSSRVIIKIEEVSSLNSGSLEQSLPFYGRIKEFNDAVKDREVVYKFF